MRRVAYLIASVCLLALSACGGGRVAAPTRSDDPPRKGGDLTVMYAADVDSLDPAVTYYQYGMNVAYATQRPLYSYRPRDASRLQPDLADGPPRISRDGRSMTIRIRTGVRFSPPVNRAVTSADVKYGIERGFTPEVAGPYMDTYLSSLKGVKAFKAGAADDIAGIRTPDLQTIVLELDKPRGGIVAASLSMPASAPVPEEYARKFDRQTPSAYGRHLVATGPYMVEADASGELTGYSPGQEIRLVRNPNWDASTDYKPAYLDSITIKEGNEPELASRMVLAGRSMVSGDFNPSPSILHRVPEGRQAAQLELAPAMGLFRYIAIRTDRPPFDNPDVRRAVNAAFDKEALRRVIGGPVKGDIPTHFLPPEQPGFLEAGGATGPGADFMAEPRGNLELARAYMKKAGYETGMYDGPQLTGVSDNAPDQRKIAQITVEQFKQLGFDVKMQYVTAHTMMTRFCRVPSNQPDVCPSAAWKRDFADSETLLGPVFNGRNIRQEGNSNLALLDDPAINRSMDAAELVNDVAQRSAAWGAVDRLITETAAGIPWLWERQAMLRSANVVGVVNPHVGTWDFAFTSLN